MSLATSQPTYSATHPITHAATGIETETETEKHPGLGKQRLGKQLLQTLPSALSLLLLAGVFAYGHHTGWRVPKAGELVRGLTGAPIADVATADDWCGDHAVPESICIECQPELLPKTNQGGYCRVHGVTDCVLCNPQGAQLTGEPQLPAYDTAAAIQLTSRRGNGRGTLHASRVQFASAASVDKAGIQVDAVRERPMLESIRVGGELVFNPTRVAQLSSRVPGTISAVFRTLGDPVAAGDVLAIVDSAAIGQLKSRYLQAAVQLQLRSTTIARLQPISNSGAIPQKAVIEAEAALQEATVALLAAQQALENLGYELPADLHLQSTEQLAETLKFLAIPVETLANLPAGTKTANLFALRAPHDGVLTRAQVVAGESVDTARPLFTVSDPTCMWLILDVREEDAKHVRTGQTVRFRSHDPSLSTEGNVAWISPAVNPETRTLQVRVNISNDDGRWRDRTFGTGEIVLRHEPKAITVPLAAVQENGDSTYVFVRDKNFDKDDSPKFFHVRQVRVGARNANHIELLAGVLTGEMVASEGSSVLMSQLLRGNLGAGCACHQ